VTRRSHKVPPPLVPVIDLGTTSAKGDRGTIQVGDRITCPPRFSDKLGVMVPRRRGVVTRLYLRGDDPRQLVDTDTGHTLLVTTCRKVRGGDD